MHAERRDPARPRRRARRAAAGRRGCRSASCRRARARRRGSRPRGRAGRGGRRRTGRSGRRRRRARACRWRRRRVEAPALLDRQVAQEALDRVDRDGAVEVARGCRRLAGVVADAAVDGRQRVVARRSSPGVLVPAGLRRGRATPGCSRRPGRRCCRAAAGRRRPGAPRAAGRPLMPPPRGRERESGLGARGPSCE